MRVSVLLTVALSSTLLAAPVVHARQATALDGIPPDRIMRELQKKFGAKIKEYQRLADAIDKDVVTELGSRTWSCGEGTKPLKEHPQVVWVDSLAKMVREEFDKPKSPTKEKQKQLEEYPWGKDLELVLGLQHGADREVPKHINGFIDLGDTPEALRGFPLLAMNQYLYGLGEVVGWQYRVKQTTGAKATLKFLSRDKTVKAEVEWELPPSERIRVALLGVQPDLALVGLPEMTHLLHSELMKRRMSGGEPARMDKMLTFMDSRWNGLKFVDPFTGGVVPIACPFHTLFTEQGGGFIDQFPRTATLLTAGDLPFVAIQTNDDYGKKFLGKDVPLSSLGWQTTPEGTALKERFVADSTYLKRYKNLLEMIVRAILLPNQKYPPFLAAYDFKVDTLSTANEREKSDAKFGAPRKYFVLLWAYSGKDIGRLAEFVHEFLSRPQNVFPNNVALPSVFSSYLYEKEQEMLKVVGERIAKDRAEHKDDYEREFCPFRDYLGEPGPMESDYLLSSYQYFHGLVGNAIRDVALRHAAKEVGASLASGK
jgi:hypothetical protein